jgi:ribosome recycling factor
MIDDILGELKADIAKAHDGLKKALSKIRTGRANPDLLDGVRVDYWGVVTPLSQVATISVPEPRMLFVKVWDRQNVKAVERAILEADLGLNPQTDGELIRLPLPALTEERRRELTKVARKNGEECKVGIRKHRQDARAMLEGLKDEGDVGEDDVDRALKKVDEVVQAATAMVDEIVGRREKDIMEM